MAFLRVPRPLLVWNLFYGCAAAILAAPVPFGFLLGPRGFTGGAAPILPGLLFGLVELFVETPVVLVWLVGLVTYCLIFPLEGGRRQIGTIATSGALLAAGLVVADTVIAAIGCSFVSCFIQ
jgi:hypothetical protein